MVRTFLAAFLTHFPVRGQLFEPLLCHGPQVDGIWLMRNHVLQVLVHGEMTVEVDGVEGIYDSVTKIETPPPPSYCLIVPAKALFMSMLRESAG